LCSLLLDSCAARTGFSATLCQRKRAISPIRFLQASSLTDMKSVIYYVFSGAVMFAPYLANQLQNAFRSFGGAVAVPQTVVQSIQPVVPPAPVLVRGTAVG
jgi:hypothetical protein